MDHRRWFFLIIYSLLAQLSIINSSDSDEQIPSTPCHSCVAHCIIDAGGRFNPAECDCLVSEVGSNNNSRLCYGEYCFAKLEIFPEDATAIIQKGCVKGLPQGLEGCHYYGQTESVHCYCQGELCNVREQFNNFQPNPLPSVDCCKCSPQSAGDNDKEETGCPNEGCSKHCRGNYCLVDLGGTEQGCGQGIARLQSFLRTPYYLDSLQGGAVCARYQSGPENVIQGCVCTEHTGMCNELNRTRSYQLSDVVMRRLDDQNYCYSLSVNNGDRPFNKSVFRRAETCEGHYCFVSLTSVELVVESNDEVSGEFGQNSTTHVSSPQSYTRPKFEMLAGCLKVDDDEKVGLGCTVEYTDDPSRPTSKHCICNSHLCNYFDLLANTGSIEESIGRREGMLWDGADDDPNNAAFDSKSAAQCLWRITVFFLITSAFF